jgi:hypothetical protein
MIIFIIFAYNNINRKIMKKTLLLLFAMVSLATSAQYMITDKGYFYSPDGFKCRHGHIYTNDMKTLVRTGWYGRDDWDQHYLVEKLIEVPSGAEVIPSHFLYGPAGEAATGYNWLYAVVIPSSVQWIATDAFLMPRVVFFSGETPVESAPEINADPNATELARFNVEGQRIDGPQPGVNIVLMSDGTAHKVMVK